MFIEEGMIFLKIIKQDETSFLYYLSFFASHTFKGNVFLKNVFYIIYTLVMLVVKIRQLLPLSSV